jgi:hypothetical protein
MKTQISLFLPLALATICLCTPTSLAAATIWNGPTTTFTKADLADYTQAANQDRLTANVWLTRANTQGLLNIKAEMAYTHFYSPLGTEWAYGALANYNTLTYQNWEAWNGTVPPSMVGQNAVLHLISDDIYLSVKFTSWTQATGGGFSYIRSTPVPEPSALILAGLGALVLVFRFHCRRSRAAQLTLRPDPS